MGDVMRCYPRQSAVASLKPIGPRHLQPRREPLSTAISRGLIEASTPTKSPPSCAVIHGNQPWPH